MPIDSSRAQAVFVQATEIADPAARTSFIAESCGGDHALRARVEALLRAHDQADSLLDVPLVNIPRPGEDSTKAFSPNQTTAGATNVISGDAADIEPLTFLEPPTRPDSLGRIGHYHVLQILGRGAFGIVFRAFDDVLQRVVAVKVMAPQLAATSPARRRFMREAQSSAKVRHDNVVQVHDVKEQPLPYLVMEFIPGETLQQMLDRTGPLDVKETLRIGRQIAEGLAAAHATDLIHRDIKPGNILIEDGQRRVKITDFGLARAADDASISQSGIIAGTPMYMAPEQAKGEKLDQRADLFSLGSVLYQMLTGRPPFRANGTVAVLKRVADDTPRDIREIIPETPPWICNIIAKLHEKKPDERYQSAREVAEVLADCEAQFKAHSRLKDFSRIPRNKPQQPAGRKWLIAAAVVLLPVMAFALTEFFGVTHLLQGRHSTIDPIGPVEPNVAKAGTPIPSPKRVALEFDGDADYVATPLTYDGSTPLTVEATVQITEWPIHRKQYHSEIVGCTEQAGFGMGTSKDGFYIAARIGDNYVTCYSDPDERYLNRPIKLVGVLEAKKLRLYIDGKRVARNAFEHRFMPSPEKISLGTSPGQGKPHDGNGYEWAGTMFEVRISNISRYNDIDYDSSAPLLADQHTMVLYKCDEGSGDVLTDSSGNGRHGKIVGAKWVKAGGLPVDLSPGSTSTPVAKEVPPTFKNALGMEFVLVPKGKSWLGGSKDKLGDKEVTIPADFYLGKYEVTQEEWEKVMVENPSWFSRAGEGKDVVKDISDADLKRFPVENVSWDQCQIFVAKLNQREKESGWVYRLPTETEWEYACRGGPMADKLDSAYNFYFARPTNTLLPEQANFDKGLNRTCQVGLYEANRLGLFDMQGNVWEFLDNTQQSPEGMRWFSRGGSWRANSRDCQAWVLGLAPRGYHDESWGLRLARVPSGAASPETKTPPAAVAPFTDADVKRIAALPAEQQVEEVRKELMRRNPGFDGKVEPTIDNNVVVGLKFRTEMVDNIEPVRALKELKSLECSGNDFSTGKLADLSPLKGLTLTRLVIGFSQVRDLEPLKGMPLKTLAMATSQVRDLAPLKGMMLEDLQAQAIPVSDLTPLQGMPLKGLDLFKSTGVKDLQPLKSMPLVYLNLSGLEVSDFTVLKGLKSLEYLVLAEMKQLPDLKLLEGLRLTRLEMEGSRLTDKEAEKLAAIKTLTYLRLQGTQVTMAGVEKLAKALPKCKIEWDGGVIEPK